MTLTSQNEDSVARFAADLRKLRLESGNPTLAHLQHNTGISRTVLSDALSGRQLPSARTVAGLVRAFGESPAAWVDRRDALAGRAVTPPASPAEPESGPTEAPNGTGTDAAAGAFEPSSGGVRTLTRRTALLVALGAFVLGSVISGTVAALVVSQVYVGQLSALAQEGPRIVVETGEDPAATPCVEDAAVATGDTRADNSLLEIVWSDRCQAGWGRITRYDGKYQGNTVTIAIYPQTAPNGPDRQEATEHDVQGAYTTLVVRPSPDTLLCAEGSFTVDGKRIDLGDPLCI